MKRAAEMEAQPVSPPDATPPEEIPVVDAEILDPSV